MSRQGAKSRVAREVPFVLEAHYYEGGLRVKLLGADVDRPAWVPPFDYVGFRNELDLADGDSVIEFARFLFQGRRVTWIGVFKRAEDQVFGDRQNHAGVGVWLLENDVVNPAMLLIGLRQFAEKVAAGKVDSVMSSARRFISDDYLPTYLRTDAGLPSQLGGWTFSPTAMPESALFVAVGESTDELWESVADQILRMSLLPGQSSNCARALILVPYAIKYSESGPPNAALKPVGKDFLKDLLTALPLAVSDIAEQNRSALASSQEMHSLNARLKARLSELEEANGNLNDKISELMQQVQDSDILRRLASMDRTLDRLDNRTSVIDSSVKNLLNNRGSNPMRSAVPEPSTERTQSQNELFYPQKNSSYGGYSPNSSKGLSGVEITILSVTTVIIVVLFFFVWWSYS